MIKKEIFPQLEAQGFLFTGEDIKGANLFIQNIPKNMSEEEFEKLFEPYGKIVQRTLLKDKATGIPKGSGFVR